MSKGMILSGFWGLLLILAVFFMHCDAPDPTGPASSARITLTATDLELPADGTSTTLITAVIKNPQGNPAEGPVYWSTTCGTPDKSSETITGGVSQMTLTAPNYACIAEVTADAVHAKKSIQIKFYPVDAYSIEVTANPRQIPADGSATSTISAVIKDSRGLPIEDGSVVQFTTTGGFLSAESSTTSAGRATVSLRSETVPKDAKVTASVGSVSGSCTVRFYSTQIGRIELEANPDSGIPSDGVSSSIITATVYDVHGNLAEDGTTVYFVTTWGNLSAGSAITNKGVATVILRSNYNSYSGNIALVTAVSGDATDSVEVQFERYQGTQPPTSLPTQSPTPTTVLTASPTPQFSSTPTTKPATSTPAPSVTPSPSSTTSLPTYTAINTSLI